MEALTQLLNVLNTLSANLMVVAFPSISNTPSYPTTLKYPIDNLIEQILSCLASQPQPTVVAISLDQASKQQQLFGSQHHVTEINEQLITKLRAAKDAAKGGEQISTLILKFLQEAKGSKYDEKEKESLHDFMKRFNAATMITNGVADGLVVQAFLAGTTHKFLRFHLIANHPKKLSQLYKMVHHFTTGDKMNIDQVKSSMQTTQGSHFPKRSSLPHHHQAPACQYQP
ncbi:hypothetical protein GOBAR_DD14049 [Gossypium barbadense]|nr:hypothetical protein GOBAR_DD14049 [Gossypium barbadense]